MEEAFEGIREREREGIREREREQRERERETRRGKECTMKKQHVPREPQRLCSGPNHYVIRLAHHDAAVSASS